MSSIKILISSIFFIFIAGCSISYEKLTENKYSPDNEFSKYLLDEYKEKATYEAEEMHDWNSAKLYSEKALDAAKDIRIEPQKIEYWKISEKHLSKLNQAYDNLMTIYNDARSADPYNLAVAISSLDCWAEQQEENWQTWDINKCKDDFLNAMHNIYSSLEEKEKLDISKNILNEKDSSNDSVSVVTKNENQNILQIIYFDFDKSNLSNVSKNNLKTFIINNKNIINNYIIIGHTDTKGTKKYNMQLSLERAKSVKELLIEYGINEKNIKLLAKGEEELLVKTEDEIPHPANRRAEISPLY